eukprot:c7879_g1_i1.p1 GENE.c7879_g1_i1~~c7879_g1_i1.p1  ORF type:complete len:443 (-),score=126.28 c7879_g1_i1:78-1349(-)
MAEPESARPQAIPAELAADFRRIVQKKYSDQAKWWLNSFWLDGADKEAEHIWTLVQLFIKFDENKRENGFELDEFYSHKVLESLNETLTVIDFRNMMRRIDLDFNRHMSLIEYLLCKYSRTVEEVISGPQGANREEIQHTQDLINQTQAAVEEMQTRLAEAKEKRAAARLAEETATKAEESSKITAKKAHEAKEAAKKTEDDAKKAQHESEVAEAAAKTAADEAAAAEEENRVALEDLARQEAEYAAKIAELEKKKEEGSTVARGKASAELDQLKAQDPLPLSRAKISQGATLRKSEKARMAADTARAHAQERTKAAQESRQKAEANREAADKAASLAEDDAKAAEQARASAVEDRKAAEEAQDQVELAVTQCEEKMKEAHARLAELKKVGTAHGDVWWMERELLEKQKYMPQKNQPFTPRKQ